MSSAKSPNLTFVRINSENISSDQFFTLRNSGLLLDLDSAQLRSLFLNKEASDRGFFCDNDLQQVSDGKIQLPLLTWSFLDYIATRQLGDQRLIELGSGNSTIWFGKKFQHVSSYETDSKWATEVSKFLPKNVEMKLIDLPLLESAEINLSSADWLLIDFAGNRTKFIFSMLKKGFKPGYVILDNAEWYRNGAALLTAEGYTEIPFFGFKSGQTWVSCTSIFLSGNSKIPEQGVFSIPRNARAIKNDWDQLTAL